MDNKSLDKEIKRINKKKSENMDIIKKELQQIRKNLDNNNNNTWLKYLNLKNWLAPSIILSLVIWGFNIRNEKNNSPLNYSLTQSHDVEKLINPNDDVYFTTTPFFTFQLDRNEGGLVKNLFLVTIEDDNIRVTAPQISNSYSKEFKPPQKLDISKVTLLWNQKRNLVNIHFSETFFDISKRRISSAFLILKGQNHSYSVITFLSKLGDKKTNYADTTISFTDLEIFDKHIWEEKTGPKTKDYFLSKYDDTIKNYQKLISWLKDVKL